jgi:hypothetical protein
MKQFHHRLFGRRNDNRKTWLKKKLTTFFKDFIFLDEGAKSWAHIKYPNPTHYSISCTCECIFGCHLTRAHVDVCVCAVCAFDTNTYSQFSKNLKVLKNKSFFFISYNKFKGLLSLFFSALLDYERASICSLYTRVIERP